MDRPNRMGISSKMYTVPFSWKLIINILELHTDSVVCLCLLNLPVFNLNCNEIYALYASAHLEWNAVLITTTFQLKWIGYIAPYHLSLCAYIKPHPIGWAPRWNIMQIPNNKYTWLNSLSQQIETMRTYSSCTRCVCMHVCVLVGVRVDSRNHAPFANYVCQCTDINYWNCQITEAHSDGAGLPCFERGK